jgi:hypothetical protein
MSSIKEKMKAVASAIAAIESSSAKERSCPHPYELLLTVEGIEQDQ